MSCWRGIVQAGLTTYTAQAGDIYVFAPGVPHARRQLPGEAMEYENIIFELELGGAGDICAEKYCCCAAERTSGSAHAPWPGRLGLQLGSAVPRTRRRNSTRSKTWDMELCIKLASCCCQFLAALVGRAGDLPCRYPLIPGG
ncbi:MAG: hypothetical protein ACLUFT_10600 [Gemmiger formicilis]|uniref:hypothetical protein n=1 Tax=Gemmiger formicilis TaxID=745368 RepID=UPI0039944D0E